MTTDPPEPPSPLEVELPDPVAAMVDDPGAIGRNARRLALKLPPPPETITLGQALSRLQELEQVVGMCRPIVASVALRPGKDSERARRLLEQLDALGVGVEIDSRAEPMPSNVDYARNIVYTGAVAPEGLTVNVVPDDVVTPDTPLDLTTVVSAVYHVTDPRGRDRYWTATLSDQTTDTLRLTYLYQAADIDFEGEGWRVVARLTLAGGGVRRTRAVHFNSEKE